MNQFATKTINEANITCEMGTNKRMRIVATLEQFVDDDTLINKVDWEVATS